MGHKRGKLIRIKYVQLLPRHKDRRPMVQAREGIAQVDHVDGDRSFATAMIQHPFGCHDLRQLVPRRGECSVPRQTTQNVSAGDSIERVGSNACEKCVNPIGRLCFEECQCGPGG